MIAHVLRIVKLLFFRTFEADADAVSSVEAGAVLRRLEHVSLRVGLRQVGVGNNANPVVVGLVRETFVLEVDIVDVHRVDGENAGVQRSSVVRYLDAVVVVSVYGQCLVSMWSVRGHCVVNIWPLCGQCLVNA